MGPKEKKAHKAEPDEVQKALSELKQSLRSQHLTAAVDALERAWRSAALHKKSLTALTSGIIGSVLYACSASDDAAHRKHALQWFERRYSSLYTDAVATPSEDAILPFDERVGSLGLRLMLRCGAPDTDIHAAARGMMSALGRRSDAAHEGRMAPTRRMLTPLIESCVASGNVGLIADVIGEAVTQNIEVRDVDVAHAAEAALRAASHADAEAGVLRVLRSAAAVKPLVGGPTAALVSQVLRGSVTVPSSSILQAGACPRCGGTWGPYRFDPEQQQRLLREITFSLVKPHCDERAARHASDPTAAVAFEKFTNLAAEIHSLTDVSAVLDGANVGFFGLSSWYSDAKRSQHAAKGGDVDALPPTELCLKAVRGRDQGTDVSPDFALIDGAIQAFSAKHNGKTPLVFLHERHLSCSGSPDNARYLRSWREQQIRILATPHHVNDDACWMYAAVRHQCPVISNDQMRDHHARLPGAPLDFIKWRATNRITFKARFDHAAPGPVHVVLRDPPRALMWMSVSNPDAPSSGVEQGYQPLGTHIPFTRDALLEDKGKLLPGGVGTNAVPAGHILLPESPADLMDFALSHTEGWICYRPDLAQSPRD